MYTRISGGTYTWTAKVPKKARYKVYMWWSSWSSRAPEVPVEIEHAGGVARRTVDQRRNAGRWNELGTFEFTGTAAVTIRSISKQYSMCADAVRLVEVTP
jgi:hypothetical protein